MMEGGVQWALTGAQRGVEREDGWDEEEPRSVTLVNEKD